MGLEIFAVVVGSCLMAIAAFWTFRWREEAAWVKRWYESMSREDGRPWWRRGHFRPTERQAIFIAWLKSFVAAALGLYFILADGLKVI